MRVLAICPRYDSPGRRDVSGAFLPEAREFVKIHGGSVVQFDNRKSLPARLRETISLISAAGELDAVAFFCHGTRRGLQAGATLATMPDLRLAIHASGARYAPLYACDAARDADAEIADDLDLGPGGHLGAAWLLASGQVQVDAHVTTGHTTRNPHVRRFRGQDGEWIVAPKSRLWVKWKKRLRDDRVFRLSFPLMSLDEIRSSLA